MTSDKKTLLNLYEKMFTKLGYPVGLLPQDYHLINVLMHKMYGIILYWRIFKLNFIFTCGE